MDRSKRSPELLTRLNLDSEQYPKFLESLEWAIHQYNNPNLQHVPLKQVEELLCYASHPSNICYGPSLSEADLRITSDVMAAYHDFVSFPSAQAEIERINNFIRNVLHHHREVLDEIYIQTIAQSPIPNSVKDLTI